MPETPNASLAQPSASKERPAEKWVEAYYEANSRRFLRYGQGGGQGSIHRAVWAPGVSTEQQAFEHVNALVLKHLGVGPEITPHVVDLGCGIGATLTYLAQNRALTGLGVTLSALQVSLAQERFARLAPDAQLRCVQGSFLQVPEPAGSFDAAYAIEAFIHTDDPRQFFAESARLLKPGGVLLVCDDFLSPRALAQSVSRRERRWLAEFKQGWRVNSLRGVDEFGELAPELELTQQIDLTPYLELNRPRDVLIRGLVGIGRYLPLTAPWWGNFLGGNALQRCLLSGAIEYRFLVFRRRA
jgi:cyclopropane fatty-acyl-phospholipid synthase-like methyltransferase